MHNFNNACLADRLTIIMLREQAKTSRFECVQHALFDIAIANNRLVLELFN